MFCPNCGEKNINENRFCTKCGEQIEFNKCVSKDVGEGYEKKYPSGIIIGILLVVVILGIIFFYKLISNTALPQETDMKKDIDKFYAEQNEAFEVSSIVIEKRQTSKSDKEDRVWCSVALNCIGDGGSYTRTEDGLMEYVYYDQGGWILEGYKSSNISTTPDFYPTDEEILDYAQTHFSDKEVTITSGITSDDKMRSCELEIVTDCTLYKEIQHATLQIEWMDSGTWNYDVIYGEVGYEITMDLLGDYTAVGQNVNWAPTISYADDYNLSFTVAEENSSYVIYNATSIFKSEYGDRIKEANKLILESVSEETCLDVVVYEEKTYLKLHFASEESNLKINLDLFPSEGFYCNSDGQYFKPSKV